MEEQTSAYDAFRARANERLNAIVKVKENAIRVGDRLPAIPLRDQRGAVSVETLVSRGYRYLYLYRDDCRGCIDLTPAWEAMTASATGKVAHIAYRLRTDLPVGPTADHFAFQGSQATDLAALTEFVPAMIVLREDGYVIGVADGFPAMLRHLRLHRVVQADVLEELSTRRAASAPKGTRAEGIE